MSDDLLSPKSDPPPRLQFRLKTLLILFTVLSLLMGLMAMLGLEEELHIFFFSVPVSLAWTICLSLAGALLVVLLMIIQIPLTWLMRRWAGRELDSKETHDDPANNEEL